MSGRSQGVVVVSVIVKGKNPSKPYTVRYEAPHVCNKAHQRTPCKTPCHRIGTQDQCERSFQTRREANDFKIKIDHDLRVKIFVDDKLGRQNFGQAAETWLNGLARSEQTKLVYASLVNVHVLPAFGSKTIAQVANDRDGVAQLVTVTMAHLSHTRRSKTLYVITSVLDEAVKAGKIPNHRIAGIDLVDNGTRNDHGDFVFPSHSQLVQLADALNGNGLTIWLMRGCGLRIAEAMAVKKSDFRDDGRTLRVSEQVLRSGNVAPLKSRKANEFRDVPVPSYLWEMVRDLPEGYLFMRNGKCISYSAYLESFKRHARKAGIPDKFTPHSLRHVFVSALLTRGVAITDVAKWVGHKDISVTYSVYGHLIPSAAARAVSVLDDEYDEWSLPAQA
jgi:integrase